jgi:2-phospho-L-lactate guanylyltransferase (CobY/MobA/RfbA family)
MPEAAAPTLLVFTLGAARESARRSLLPRALQGMEIGLRQACFEAAVEAGRACGCRVAVCSPERGWLPEGVEHLPQASGDFGDRLERACAKARGRRRGPLLVVGTDVPGLADRHLRAALTLLGNDRHRVVLGPGLDGGVYLLASLAPLPPLSAVRWCRSSTLADLSRVLTAAGCEVALLEPLADLDRPADLERLIAGSPGRKGRRTSGAARRRSLAESKAAAPAAAPIAPVAAPAAERVRPLADLVRRALAERRRPAEPPPAEPHASPTAPRVTGRAPPFSRLH